MTTAPTDKLRLSEKLSYSLGDLASCLFWQTFMLYLTYYYTDVFGISALAAAAMLGLSRSLDAFFDPVMGMLGDRTNTRWGKYRPYLLWICVPFAIAGVLTFTTPGTTVTGNLESIFGSTVRGGLGVLHQFLQWLTSHTQFFHHLPPSIVFSFVPNTLSEMAASANTLQGEVNGKLIWALLTYNALMILYTAINIPYTAMLGVITPNPKERTSLSSIKFVGAFMGGILISFFLLPGVKAFSAGNEARGWQVAFIIVGIIAVGLFLATFFNTKERVQPPKAQKTPVWRDLLDLVTNVPWLVLLATTITFILYVAARGSVTVHYFKYYVKSEHSFEDLVSWFNGTGQIASLLGVILVPYFANLAGKKLAFICIFLVAIACTASFYVLKPDQIALMFGLNILGSLTGGPLSALIWAMYADSADYSEWKKGRRATGLVFSASIFSQKQGWAIGAAVALGLMSKAGFQANTAQTAESLHGLVSLMSIVPAKLGILSIIIVLLYPLSEKKVAQISADLKTRREADGNAPTV